MHIFINKYGNAFLRVFIFLGVVAVGYALHSASGRISGIVLAIAWIWVVLVYVLTMFSFSGNKKSE